MLKHPTLTIQRIQQFAQRLRRHIRPERVALQVEVAGPVGRISYEEAQGLKYRAVKGPFNLEPAWSTFWFRLSGEIPAAWRKRPVDLIFDGESEAQLWIDGKPQQGLNYERQAIFADGCRTDARLPQDVVRRGIVSLQVEAAANGLFGLDHTQVFPFRKAELALFDQEAWDLCHDLLVPVGFISVLLQQNVPGLGHLGAHTSSLAPWQGYLLEKLNEVCNAADSEDRSTWKNIRPLLKEIYQHHNATMVHELSAIGHAHIDTAWLWPLAETKRKCARTFSTALSYMKRYPSYKFSCSQAHQYQWMKDSYPTIYAGIKAAVKRGQWVPVGGSWIEPDCNIPSGESLARQFLYGKRFFRKEFGWDCKEFWNPDVFGYSGALPQILKLSGIDYFLTQKLSWNQFNKPPYKNFYWRGIDGSQVLTHFPPSDTYNSMTDPLIIEDLLRHEAWAIDHDRTNEGLLLYGYGDGGGGPTTHMLEVLDRVADFQGLPRTAQRTSLEFFKRMEARMKSIPVVEGELYFELHRGTYTTQAANKRDNRRAEFLLRGAEMLSVIAGHTAGHSYPARELERIWKIVLLNQFHDILPGSSIAQVYEDSARDYAEVIAKANELEKDAATALADRKSGGFSVINTCGWERTGLVELEQAPRAGAQKSWNSRALVPVTVPACGAAPIESAAPAGDPVSVEKLAKGFCLENRWLRAEFSIAGPLTRLTDKRNGRELIDAAQPANQFVLFEDYPLCWEAWDVDIFHLEKKSVVPPALAARILESGPHRAGLEFTYVFNGSTLTQRVFLGALLDQIEFECDIDWQTRKRFLKVEFPVGIHAPEASFEIQFGHLKRPTHFSNSHDMARFEVSAHKWIDLSETGYGAALLTDSKYGYAVHGNVMRISLLRGTDYPAPKADLGRHSFRFALFPHTGTLAEAGVVRRAYEFNAPWITAPGTIDRQSWFSVDSPNLVIDTVKKAEDSDALVVRLYECHGARGEANLQTSLPFRKATRVNLLEEPMETLSVRSDRISISFLPFQIISVLLET